MDDIIKDAREAFERAADCENDNRENGIEDLRFSRLGEQWPDAILKQREEEGRPCLTINKMPAFVRQVVNDSRQNKPAINVHPVDGNADKDTAEVINGLIRNIERMSNADIAYDTAIDQAVSSGFGYLRIGVDYADETAFELDISIERVVDQFSVYGDPDSTSADGSDWNVGFITERMSKNAYKARFGEDNGIDWDDGGDGKDDWHDEDGVRVAEYWTRDLVDAKIYRLRRVDDGSFIIVDEARFMDNDIAPLVQQGFLQVKGERAIKRHKVTQRIINGQEVLETTDWAGKFIPIVPVYGDEFWVNGKRHLHSLIRDAKDPARMHNFWRTASTELVALAPRVPYIGEQGAFDADPNGWATANTVSHPYLEYSKGKQMPVRQPLDSGGAAGAMTEALAAADDMKAVMGLHDASLGAKSNETSGRAIMARQREGDVSTFHFIDNLTRAIRQAGNIILDLIPHVYDSERIIRVLGEDGSERPVQINSEYQKTDPKTGEPQTDERDEAIIAMHDLRVGKYDLTVSSGPGFTTRREQAAYEMTEFVRAFPAAAPIIGDLIAKNSEWPESDTVAERLEALAPQPQQQLPPEVQQALQEGRQALQELQNIKSGKQIEAFRAETDRMKAEADIASKVAGIDKTEAETDLIEVNTAAALTQPIQ